MVFGTVTVAEDFAAMRDGETGTVTAGGGFAEIAEELWAAYGAAVAERRAEKRTAAIDLVMRELPRLEVI